VSVNLFGNAGNIINVIVARSNVFRDRPNFTTS